MKEKERKREGGGGLVGKGEPKGDVCPLRVAESGVRGSTYVGTYFYGVRDVEVSIWLIRASRIVRSR